MTVAFEHVGNAANEQAAAAFKGPFQEAGHVAARRSSRALVVSSGISSLREIPVRGYIPNTSARFNLASALLLGRTAVIDSWYLYRIDSADKLEDTARRIADLHELWSRVHCD